MTFSIVARDPDTGALGVAVETAYFAVGRICPWARAGVGAVATQAFAEPRYGPVGLELLASGHSAAEALDGARKTDESAAVRQVAMVDALGRVAAFTGELCVPAAGHRVADAYSVQGNMLDNENVWIAMGDAFEASSGDLGARLLDALDAGQAAGGDARGKQSAALLVVDGERREDAWAGYIHDLRVDDHEAPLAELRRLYEVSSAFNAVGKGLSAGTAGDVETAITETAAAVDLLPADGNVRFGRMAALAVAGQLVEARATYEALVHDIPGYAGIVRGFVERGLMPLDEDAVHALLD